MSFISTTRLAIVALLLALGATGCQTDEPDDASRPSWMEGTWTGRLAWEHDTTSHRLHLNLDDERFVYPALDCRGTLKVDSTTARFTRVRFVAAHDSLRCGEVSGGIAELHTLDDPGSLHLQYWPRNDTKLYLTQLRPRE